MTVTLFDDVSLDGVKRRKTADGYVVAMTPIARTGIHDYLGRELDPDGEQGLEAGKVYKAYRPKEAVMDRGFIESLNWKPITDAHPAEGFVNADNWRDLAVGMVGEVVVDGERVMAAMMLTDAAIQRKIDGGISQVSVGYESEIIYKAGVTDSGEAFDVIQKPIRANHVAVVERGRAGPKFRVPSLFDAAVSDAVKQEYGRLSAATQGVKMSLTKIMVGDASFNVAEDDAAKLLGVIAAKDTEIGELKAECAEANGKILTEEQVWSQIGDLLALIDSAKQIVGDAYDGKGKSAIEIKKDVVRARFGDEAVADAASDAELDGLYKGAVRAADNSMVEALKKKTATVADADSDYEAAIQRAQDKRFGKA